MSSYMSISMYIVLGTCLFAPNKVGIFVGCYGEQVCYQTVYDMCTIQLVVFIIASSLMH